MSKLFYACLCVLLLLVTFSNSLNFYNWAYGYTTITKVNDKIHCYTSYSPQPSTSCIRMDEL